MKKFMSVLLISVLLLSSCSNMTRKGDKKTIVCTVFPVYDWVCSIIGDENEAFEIKLLLDSKVDLHSYSPTPDDLVAVSECDLFIYIGGESDEWVTNALKVKQNESRIALNLMDALSDDLLEEEQKEGMEPEDEGGEEEKEYDEHIWLSLRNAASCCKSITDKLKEIEGDKPSVYEANCENYVSRLNALDAEYFECAQNAKCKTLLFGDRFPFAYLVSDYGLDYYAAFRGCSAESEASFETIRFLSGKVDELQLKYVMTLEGSDNRIANTIISSTANKNASVLSLNSMQAVASEDMKNGVTYISIAESNLNVLKTALGAE